MTMRSFRYPIAVAVEQVGARGLGRVRMRQIPDASADSLQAFIAEAITPGSLVHTDGWLGYERLEQSGYGHRITFVKGQRESASELLPRVHRVVSLLKRWLLGTHHGGVSFEHLDSYLDEFTFRFNRRSSRSRGKLFYRLAQQAVAVEPVPYKHLIAPITTCRGYRIKWFLTQMCARFSPSRSAAPWEEAADVLVLANQR